jgi:UrcA family protein
MNAKILGGSLVAAALLALGTPAAADSWSTDRVTVNYSGIDLASSAGRVKFERRLASAINGLCGTPVLGTLEEAETLRACRAEAREAAEPQVRAVLAVAAAQTASIR